MKKYFLWAAVLPLCVGLCLTSCKKSNDDLLIGTWNAEKVAITSSNGDVQNITLGEQNLADYMANAGAEISSEYSALLNGAKVNIKYQFTFEKKDQLIGQFSTKYTGIENLLALLQIAVAIEPSLSSVIDMLQDTESNFSGTYSVDGDKLKVNITEGEFPLPINEFTIKTLENKKCVLEATIQDGSSIAITLKK